MIKFFAVHFRDPVPKHTYMLFSSSSYGILGIKLGYKLCMYGRPILTVVVRGILVGGAGVLDEREIGQHFPTLPKVHQSAARDQHHLNK